VIKVIRFNQGRGCTKPFHWLLIIYSIIIIILSCPTALKWNTGKLYCGTVELPSKPNMHARIKPIVKVDYDEFQRNSGRKARRQEKLKNLKSSYPTGGKKARKGEVRQEQRQE
jgi:hypothetical protein